MLKILTIRNTVHVIPVYREIAQQYKLLYCAHACAIKHQPKNELLHFLLNAIDISVAMLS
jgi:hypothetical protein